MWVGSWVSAWFVSMGVTLPAYIGAMLVAAVLRNLDDVTKLIGMSQRTIDDLGAHGAVAVPRHGADDAEAVGPGRRRRCRSRSCSSCRSSAIMIVAGTIVFRVDGPRLRSGGDVRRLLRLHARAPPPTRWRTWRRWSKRYGPAPKAFLVVPMVGAFFIDFTNAIIITGCLNFVPVIVLVSERSEGSRRRIRSVKVILWFSKLPKRSPSCSYNSYKDPPGPSALRQVLVIQDSRRGSDRIYP